MPLSNQIESGGPEKRLPFTSPTAEFQQHATNLITKMTDKGHATRTINAHGIADAGPLFRWK